MNTSSLASYLNLINSRIGVYTTTIVFPTGVFLNLLAIIVNIRPNLNKTNMGYLYIWQSVVNILMLSIGIITVPIREIYGINLASKSDFVCSFITFMMRFAAHISSWMNVFICLDRFVFVRFATSTYLLKSKFKLTIVIIFGFTLIGLINIPNFFFSLNMRSINQANQTITSYVCGATQSITLATTLISILLRTFLPSACMIVMNVIIVRKLRSNAKLRATKTSRSNNIEQNFTRTVISLNIIFVLFYLPLAIAYLLNISLVLFNPQVSPVTTAAISLFLQSGILFGGVNESLFFFIQLIFNRVFRKEVLSNLPFVGINTNNSHTLFTNNSQQTNKPAETSKL
jgi:hypothetical protein